MNDLNNDTWQIPDEISIKSKERVDKFGEVFTPSNIVNDMLDMEGVKEYSYSLDKTFLEPSCGNGNFLVEILSRKLSCLDCIDKEDAVLWEMSMLQALSTIYGIDIQADNIEESKTRMKSIVMTKYRDVYGIDMGESLENSIRTILNNNIVCGNFLTEKFATTFGGNSCTSRNRKNTISAHTRKENETLELLEWEFNFERKQVTVKSYTLDAIRDKTYPSFECKPVRYSRLADAEIIEVDNSNAALGI